MAISHPFLAIAQSRRLVGLTAHRPCRPPHSCSELCLPRLAENIPLGAVRVVSVQASSWAVGLSGLFKDVQLYKQDRPVLGDHS